MGNFTQHVVFGLLAASVTMYLLDSYFTLDQTSLALTSVAFIVGSVLPDVDHDKAYAHKGAKVLISLGSAVATVLYAPVPIHLGLAAAAGVFTFTYVAFDSISMSHRGFTHSLSFAAIITSIGVIAAVYLIATPLPGLALMIGTLSHLLLDREFKLV